MKTFTAAEVREIQDRIEAATGLPFAQPRPDCFLSASIGHVVAVTDDVAYKMPALFVGMAASENLKPGDQLAGTVVMGLN